MPEATSQLRLEGERVRAPSSAAGPGQSKRLDVGQPHSAPQPPAGGALRLQKPGERHGFCSRGYPWPTEPLPWCRQDLSTLRASRPWGRAGRQVQPPRRGPLLIPTLAPGAPRFPCAFPCKCQEHTSGHVCHTTQETRGSGRSDVTLGGCPCPATRQGRLYPALRP